MSVPKHTPGPWIAEKTFGNSAVIGPVSKEKDQSYGMVLPVAYIEEYDWPDNHKANARLIEAAPDLYDALFPNGSPTVEQILRRSGFAYEADAIKRAIEKVKGLTNENI